MAEGQVGYPQLKGKQHDVGFFEHRARKIPVFSSLLVLTWPQIGWRPSLSNTPMWPNHDLQEESQISNHFRPTLKLKWAHVNRNISSNLFNPDQLSRLILEH
jgi:hypothetical protein